MKNKEIIKKLEAVICEMNEEENELEILCSDNTWGKSAFGYEELKNPVFIYRNEKYIYYANLQKHFLYRVKR